MKKRIYLLIGILIIVILAASCTWKKVEEPNIPIIDEKPPVEEGNFPIEITDDFGNLVKFDKSPDTIISLSPNNTEILYALGLGDKVIGITSDSDYPEQVLLVEKIGDLNGINLDRIIELNPDLVLVYGPGNKEDNLRLKEAGIPTLAFMPKSIDAIIYSINTIAEVTATTEKAKVLTQNMIQKEDKLINLVKNAKKKTVFYEYEISPLKTSGSGSLINVLINLAGGINIAENEEGDYPLYNFEKILDKNPEVYLTSSSNNDKITEIKSRPGFNNIKAVKSDNVYSVDSNIVSTPGPRIVDALELIARAIHPEVFK